MNTQQNNSKNRINKDIIKQVLKIIEETWSVIKQGCLFPIVVQQYNNKNWIKNGSTMYEIVYSQNNEYQYKNIVYVGGINKSLILTVQLYLA